MGHRCADKKTFIIELNLTPGTVPIKEAFKIIVTQVLGHDLVVKLLVTQT